MSRILLADHSPHAQRMGERILRDEGFEVVTVTDGDTALLRLKDIEPDLILADISLPSRNGYEICDYVKNSGKYPDTRVVLTAGPLVPLDQARATQVRSDGFVKKPFEASMLIEAVQPLLAQPVPAATPSLVNVPAVDAPPARRGRAGHRNRCACAARPRTDSRRRDFGARSFYDCDHRECHRQSRHGSRWRPRRTSSQIDYA